MNATVFLPELMQLVDLLYDAATDLTKWRDFLEAASRLFRAQGANLLHVDEINPALSMSLICGFDHVDIETQARATRRQVELQREDPRIAYSLKYPNKPFRCTDVMPAADFHATRIYREVLHPSGIEYSLMVQYSDVTEIFTGLAFLRRPNQPPFSDQETDVLGALVPHLRRALAIQKRVYLLESQAQAGYQVLDTLPVGVIIMNPQGRVDYANAAARDVFALNDGIELADEKLIYSRCRDQDAVAAALLTVGDIGGHQAVRLERPSGMSAFQLLVTRLSASGASTLPNLLAQPRLALFISNPDEPLETSAQLLQRLFGLTPTEGRVLERIVAGRSPEEVAADLGVGLTTVRSHLKALFAKTGANKQSDLIQKVLLSPAYLARV